MWGQGLQVPRGARQVRSEGIRHFQRWLCQGAAAGQDRNVTAEHLGVCRADQDPAGQAIGKTFQVENRSQPPVGISKVIFLCSLSTPSSHLGSTGRSQG